MGAVPRHSWLGPAAGIWGGGWSLANPGGGPVGAVPRQSGLGPAPGFAAVVSRLSWRGALWVQFPAILGWGLLLPLVRWSLAKSGRGPFGCCSPPILAGACCWLWCGGPSPFPAEGPVGAVLRQSWSGRLLALVGWVVLRHSWRRALWVQFPAFPGWGLLLAWVRWSFAFPGGGPCGRCAPPFLAGACRWLWWGCPPPFPVVGPVVAASCPSWHGPAATLDFIRKNVNFVFQLFVSLSFCLRCITKHNVCAVFATWKRIQIFF